VDFELLLELKIEQKRVLHCIHRVVGFKTVRNSLCADRASVRPSDIFGISNSVHPDLASSIHWWMIVRRSGLRRYSSGASLDWEITTVKVYLIVKLQGCETTCGNGLWRTDGLQSTTQGTKLLQLITSQGSMVLVLVRCLLVIDWLNRSFVQEKSLMACSAQIYAPLIPCVTRRTDAYPLTRPYNTRYAVKYPFFAQILAVSRAVKSINLIRQVPSSLILSKENQLYSSRTYAVKWQFLVGIPSVLYLPAW
jgi:hypothetical protein